MNDDFTTYRQQRGYSAKSIQGHNRHINHFKGWCTGQEINPERITYNQVLQFIDSERARGIANPSIINTVNSIRIYFDCLLESGSIGQNVVRRIRIRKSGKKVLPETISPQQLETAYHNFVNLPAWEHRTKTAKELHKRNIVVLGLLVYQGLRSGETAKLESSHISLTEGKIYIPSTRKGNARTLKLQANQILPIQHYLEELQVTGYKLQEVKNNSPYLFPTKKHSDMISSIIRQVRKLNPEIRDSRHIRSSVIMNWLKTNNIRQVQYMAGHRSIVSTEEYRKQDLTDLTGQLELFHPLK